MISFRMIAFRRLAGDRSMLAMLEAASDTRVSLAEATGGAGPLAMLSLFRCPSLWSNTLCRCASMFSSA